LILLGVWIGFWHFSKQGSPQRHREHRGIFLMSKSGDGDWLINPVVSEMKSLDQEEAQVQELITIFRRE